MLASPTPPAYRILGPLSAGTPTPRGQQARVLGVLLLERGAVVPTVELGRWALGPDRADNAAQVHVLIARLRRLLREQSLPGRVASATSGYRFEGDEDLIDAGRFDALFDAAQSQQDTDPANARYLVDAALNLWQGELLAGLGLSDHPAAARLADRRPAALELAFTADLALGRTASLPDMLEAHRRFPDRERLAVIVMTALFLAGRQTEALALYLRARQRMIGLTGLEPGADLQQAEAAVLRHDVGPILMGCLGIREPRLRTARALQPAALVDRTGYRNEGRGSWPRFVTSFVGRGELAEQLVARSTTPGLTTLVGPGGVGKTRLVCEWFHRWPVDDLRPVWFCELAWLDDGAGRGANDGIASEDDGLARLVARAVGARLEPGRRPLDAVAEQLADVDGVLVLDSCDTQIAGAAQLTSRLLASCMSLTVLATSRVPLGVPGEQVCAVPPLDLVGEAAELYCHRAIDADPGFSLGVDELDTIVQLCARLDGLPLAIELAAARSRTAGPHELLSHLDHEALGFLESSAPTTAAARHRSLDATIDWSYRLLGAEQQWLLRRLGVFSGPVEIEDLAAVCDHGAGRSALLDRLSELVERSMVTTARRSGVTHYRLLDTIRGFAVDRATGAGELDDARCRHAEHYARLLDGLRPLLRSSAEGSAAARLDQIWPEVGSAVGWSMRVARTALAVRLVAGLGFEAVFRERGEILGWANNVLSLPDVLEESGGDELLGTAAVADWGCGR